MAARAEHVVTLRAIDGVSQTFRTVGQSAQTAAVQIEGVGSKAEATAARLERMERTAVAVGAALGTGLGVIAKLGDQAEKQRIQIDGLRRAYGDAGEEILQFTEAIQSSTKFSNEDARQAAQLAATLAQNYGFTADEIKRLIEVSADLATIHGMTLADAVQRTQSAMRGEAESAEALGLTLNQQAIDRKGLTLTMSQQEAAHYRFNALLQQAAYAEGAAGAAAATSAGQAVQLSNALQDLTTDAGTLLGPLGGVASGMADLALILPVAGAGAGKFAAMLARVLGSATAAGGAVGSFGGALGAAVPLLTGLSGAAAVAAPAVIAVAAAAHQAAEAQNRWNQVQEEGNRKLAQLGDLGTDQVVRDIYRAFEEGWAVSSVTLRDTTVGVEDLRRMLLNLDETSTAALKQFADGLGGVNIDTIDAIANEIVRLTLIEQAWVEVSLELVDAQRAIMQQQFPAHLREQKAEVERLTSALDAHERGLQRVARAQDEFARQTNALRELAAHSAAGGVISFPTVADPKTAELTRIYNENLERKARAERDAARAAEEHARAAEESARAQEQERQAAVRAADALIGSMGEREAAAQQAYQAERDAARQIDHIRRAAVAEQRDLERQYARDVRGLQAERIDAERQAVRTLRGLEEERRAAAAQTEEQLRDLAQQRGDVQTRLAEQARDAEAQWLRASRENLRQQAALRADLQRTTAEAAREWQRLNAENLAQQRAIKEGLRDALQGQDIDFRRTRQDIQREMARIREDLAIKLADPNIDEGQRWQAEFDAERRLQDLRRQMRRAEQDHRRAEQQAKAKARADEKALEDERKQAQAAYHREVREAESATASRIAALERERLAAQEAFARQRRDLAADAAAQMQELAAKEAAVLDAQAARFAEIEREKLAATRAAAREREQLARQAAQLEARYGREVMQTQRQEARETARAEAQYARDAVGQQSELQRLLAEGLITRDEYNAALRAAERIQRDAAANEREALALQARQLPELARAVRLEQDRVEAVREYKREISQDRDEERLDGPVVAVTADTKPFDAELADARRRGQAFAAEAFTPTIDGNSTPWVNTVRGATNLGVALGQSVFRPTIAGDTTAWEASVKAVSGSIEELREQSVVIPILAKASYGSDGGRVRDVPEAEPFRAVAKGVGMEIEALSRRSVVIKINANTAPFWAAIRAITNRDNVGTATLRVQAQQAAAPPAKMLGGLVGAERVPAAALGRFVMVGEAGPELALLPSGSLIVPHGAAQARQKAAPAEGPRFYGPVTFVMQSPSIAAEVSRQLAGRQRQ